VESIFFSVGFQKIIIQPGEDETTAPESAWDVLERLTGTVPGPADWASEIDHYLYGTQKKAGS